MFRSGYASVFLDRLAMEAEMIRVNTESADIAIDALFLSRTLHYD